MFEKKNGRRFLMRGESQARRAQRRRQRLHARFEKLEDRRLLTVDWRNPVDSLDINQDGGITPLDALVVINDLNRNGIRDLELQYDPDRPRLDSNGNGKAEPLDALLVINALNRGRKSSMDLVEDARFDRESSVVITLGQPAGVRTYRFQVDAQIDMGDAQTALEDVLAVYLVDPANRSRTLLDGGTPGAPLFALHGDRAEYTPGQARYDGSVVEIDLSAVTDIDTGQLVFQLLSTDSDSGSRFTIRPLSNQVDPDASPGTMLQRDPAAGIIGNGIPVQDLSPAADIRVQIGNVRYQPAEQVLRGELWLSNRGESVGRTTAVAFPDLPAGVSLRNASGLTPAGVPYLNLTPSMRGIGLGRGSSSEAVAFAFDNPGGVRFPLHPVVLSSGANRPPVWQALGELNVYPGAPLDIVLDAADPDGDRVSYALRSDVELPHSILRSGGRLRFDPAPTDVGSYALQVFASDGLSEAIQDVTLNVLADPITTTRVSGRVLDVDRTPLAGMQVELGAVQTLTRGDGSFTLDLGEGPLLSQTIKVRGETYSGTATYPFIAEKLPLVLDREIYLGVNNVITRPIFLPKLDISNGKTIDPQQDTTVTTAALPGAAVSVAAGTLMNQQGTPFTGVLSMTEVPPNLTPASLPEGLIADLVVTIQPGEMVFSSPAPLTLPNRAGYAPGTLMDLWSINPVTGQFDDVGDMRVSEDGSVVETISGGIRNSSWHLPLPVLEPAPDLEADPNNQDTGCHECSLSADLTSIVELHSGVLSESHDLVSYRAQGETRSVRLVYDSLRADPRPIVHLSLPADRVRRNDGSVLFTAKLSFSRGDQEFVVPGYEGPLSESGGEHFWDYAALSQLDAAIQADFRNKPTGVYNYETQTGFLRRSGDSLSGTLARSESKLISVNSVASPLGAGWGIAGLQHLVVNDDSSVLLVDGDGSELLFASDGEDALLSPPGEFSNLERVDGLFRRTTPDQTIFEFDADLRLANITDRFANVTTYNYADGQLLSIVDPVGLATTFSYVGGRVTGITDPAGRTTSLTYDAAGNLASISDPDQSARRWEYTANHLMVAEVDQLGRRESTEYGFHGRVTGGVRKDGSRIRVDPLQTHGLYPAEQTSDPDSAPFARPTPFAEANYVDANGNVISGQLDRAGQSQADRDRVGYRKSIDRNELNLPTAITDGRGNATLMSYDDRGNMLTRHDALSGGGEIAGVLRLPGEIDRYTISGRAGSRLQLEYLEAAVLTSVTVTDANGHELPMGSSGFEQMLVLPHDGEYTLTVKDDPRFAPDTGAYRFRLLDLDAAPPLPLGDVVEGETDELVYYSFEGVQGQTLNITDRFGDNRDYSIDLRLFNARQLVREGIGEAQVLLETTGTYTLVIAPNSREAPTAYRFQASITDPASVVKSGLDVDRFGSFVDQSVHRLDFTAPAGTVVMMYTYGEGDGYHHHWRIEDANRTLAWDEPTYYMVPYSGTFTIVVQKGGYNGASDNFAMRIIDLSAAPLLTVGSTVSETLAQADRFKAYRISGTAGQQLDFGVVDAGFALWDGNQQISSIDAGNGATMQIDRTADYTLIATPLAGMSELRFTLRDTGAASPLSFAAEIQGELAVGAAPRYFYFDAKSHDKLALRDLGSSAGVRMRIHPWSRTRWPNTELLHRESALPNGDTVFRIDDTARYLVVVEADEADRPAAYHFTILAPLTNTAPLTLGAVVQDSFTQPLETNEYAFQGMKGQKLVLDWRTDSELREMTLVAPSGRTRQLTIQEWDRLVVLAEDGEYRLVATNTSYWGWDPRGPISFRVFDFESLPLVVPGTPFVSEFDSLSSLEYVRVAAAKGQRQMIDRIGGPRRMVIFDPNGEQLPNLSLEPLTFTAILDGDYLIGFDGGSQSTYEWQVTIVAGPEPDSMEIDETYEGVGAGTAEEVIAGEFEGSAGTQVFFDSRTPTGAGYIQVVDSAGGVIGQDTWNIGTAPLSTDKFFILPLSDTYTIKVFTDGGYAFRMRSVDDAPVAPLDSQIEGGAMVEGQTDLYRIPLPLGQSLYFDETAGFGASYQFSSPAGANHSRFSPEDQLQFYGDYLLQVSAGSSTEPYGFQIRDVDAAPLVPYDEPVAGVTSPLACKILVRFEGVAGQRIYFQSSGGSWFFRSSANREFFDSVRDRGFVTLPETGIYIAERDNDDLSQPAEFSVTISLPEDPLIPVGTSNESTVAATYTYDPVFNQVTSFTDELGRVTRYSIDPVNGAVQSITRVVGELGGGDDLTTTFTYLASGLLDTSTDPLGRVTDRDYDAFGNLTGITSAKGTPQESVVGFEYDSAGNRVAEIDANGNRTSFAYDVQGRLVTVTLPDPDGSGPVAAAVSRYTYDAAGNMASVVEPDQQAMSFEYDAMDRLKATTDALGNRNVMKRDANGNLTRTIDANGAESLFEYDSRNRLVARRDPGGTLTRFGYDLDDHLISVIDSLGNRTEFEFDGRGRLTAEVDPLGAVVEYTYDAADQLISKIDRLGRTTQYEHDSLGRITEELWLDADDQEENRIHYGYDAAGNLLEVREMASTVRYTRDDLNRVSSVETTGPADSPVSVLRYEYDPAGNVISVRDWIDGAQGGQNTYAYDPVDRLKTLTQSGAAVAEKRVDFAYDLLDQPVSIARFADLAAQVPVARTNFTYDPLGNLKRLDHLNPAGNSVSSFAYEFDAGSRVTSETSSDGRRTYAYDLQDQLVGVEGGGDPQLNERYTYDALGNRLTSHQSGSAYTTGPANRIESDGNFDYGYDAEGNLVLRTDRSTGAVREFGYDHRNRLVSVTDRPDSEQPASQTVRYQYDALNRRLSMTVERGTAENPSTTITYFVHDRQDIVLDLVDPDGPGPESVFVDSRYLHGPSVDQVLAEQDAAGNVHWMLADALGTIRDLVDNSGSLVDHIRYDSFGNIIDDGDPAVATRYGFTGREHDAATGLIYYRNRYYDAAIGRFVHEDPLRFGGGDTNLFRYVHNSPTLATDPTGEFRLNLGGWWKKGKEKKKEFDDAKEKGQELGDTFSEGADAVADVAGAIYDANAADAARRNGNYESQQNRGAKGIKAVQACFNLGKFGVETGSGFSFGDLNSWAKRVSQVLYAIDDFGVKNFGFKPIYSERLKNRS